MGEYMHIRWGRATMLQREEHRKPRVGRESSDRSEERGESDRGKGAPKLIEEICGKRIA